MLHTPYLPAEKKDDNLSSGKNQEFAPLSIDQPNINFRKSIPWENIAEYHTPCLPHEKKDHFLDNLDSPLGETRSFSSYDSKTKIYPVSPKQNMENYNNITNDNKKLIGSQQICLRFFQSIYSFLYKIQDRENYKTKYFFLTKDFKSDKTSRFQIIVDLARFFIISMIVVVLYGYAFLQMTIILMINFLYFVNMVSFKPFRSKIDLYFIIFNEINLNSAFCVAFILALWDIQENDYISWRINMGWILVFAYIFLMFSLIINSLIRIFLVLRYLLIIICCKNKK